MNRWSKQYQSSITHDIPAMNSLMSWLSTNTVSNDTTTIVHGDFRLTLI